MQDLCKFYKFD